MEGYEQGKPEELGDRIVSVLFVHHKSRIDWGGIETAPPRWKAGD